MNALIAPVSMIQGKGSAPALMVIGLLAAAWLAQRAAQQQKQQSTTQSR